MEAGEVEVPVRIFGIGTVANRFRCIVGDDSVERLYAFIFCKTHFPACVAGHDLSGVSGTSGMRWEGPFVADFEEEALRAAVVENGIDAVV